MRRKEIINVPNAPKVSDRQDWQAKISLNYYIYSTLFVTGMTAYRKKKTNKQQKQKSSKQLQSRQLNCI